jgi:Holliday junction resolvase RusA-like endonuclease
MAKVAHGNGLSIKRRRDIDNTAKPILDLLTKHRVIKDDSLSRSS